MEQPLLKSEEGTSDRFHRTHMVAMTINFALGAGFLSVAQPVWHAGWLALIVGNALYMVATYISSSFVLNAIIKAEALVILKRKATENPEDSDLQKLANQESIPKEELERVGIHLDMCDHKFEFTDICELFVGTRARKLLSILVTITAWTFLTTYTSVFSSNTASVITRFSEDEPCTTFGEGQCLTYYRLVALAYGIVVITLSMLTFKEQKEYQLINYYLRLILAGIVVMSAIYTAQSTPSSEKPDLSQWPVWDFSGFGKMASILAFIYVFQLSIPGIGHAMTEKKSINPKHIFRIVVLVMGIVVLAVSITTITAYGKDTLPMSALNWATFSLHSDNLEGLSHVISVFILLFPAFDMLSCFPLWAIVVGENLFGFFVPIHDPSELQGAVTVLGVKVNKGVLKKVLIFFSSALPFMVGLMVSNLANILDFTGLGSILLYGLPAWFEYISEKRIPGKTFFPSRFDGKIGIFFLSFVTIFSFITAAAQAFEKYFG